jgi:hypothetical protein
VSRVSRFTPPGPVERPSQLRRAGDNLALEMTHAEYDRGDWKE